MEEQPRRCKWCGCGYSLSVLKFGDYCSYKCYCAAKEAEKALRKNRHEKNEENQ